jgi:alcohol dehydrogenase class IV
MIYRQENFDVPYIAIPGRDGTEFTFQSYGLEVVVGRRTIQQLGAWLDRSGLRRAMIICGPTIIRRSDVVQRTQQALGMRLVGTFSQVRTHQPLEDLLAARDLARQLVPDVLVSVGGGSNITAAKVVALMLSTDRDVRDYRLGFEPPDRWVEPSAPFPAITTQVVSVVTTMGGAEIGFSSGGYTDLAKGEKVTLFGRGAVSPRLVLVDGEALATTPDAIQRSTIFAQMRVAVETFCNTMHNPVSDALALHSVRLLAQAINEGWRHEVDYLLRIKVAALIASLSGLAGTTAKGINTAIAHQIGAQFNVGHGEANAIMLPHTLRFNSSCIELSRYTTLVDVLGVGGLKDSAPGSEAGDGVAALCQRLGVPKRLRDVGVPASGLAAVADAAFRSPHLSTNPRPIHSPEPIIEILRAAWLLRAAP